MPASPRATGCERQLLAVRGCRSVRKADMIHNAYQPHMEVDAQTYAVRADGELLVCEPLAELPLAQRYFLLGALPVESIGVFPCDSVANNASRNPGLFVMPAEAGVQRDTTC
jgi:hypothetical protein